MSRMRKTAVLVLPLVLTVAVCCGRRSNVTPDETLRVQLEDDWKYWMAQYPEFATIAGYPGENARWTDYSQAAVDARAAYLGQSLERLASVDRGRLAAGNQLNYDLYRDLLQTAIDGLQFHNDAIPFRGVIPHNLMMPVNQLEGIQQDIPRVIGAMPAVTAADYEKIVSRLERIAPLVDQTIALMERGLAAGMTPPAVAVRDLPGQVAGQIVADSKQSPLLLAFSQWPARVPEGDRAALAARATSAYESSARPAFQKLHDFLVKRYLPACRQTTDAQSLPDGAKLYAYNVHWHTTTSLTPQQIHDTGQAEVKRIRGEMDKVIASSGFAGSYQDFVKFLRTDPRFYFTDAAVAS